MHSAELRREIEVRLEQIERSEALELRTEEEQRAVFADIKERGRERLAKKHRSGYF
jgi:hypothetical protein